jgi:26S proteasome regulatory subunit N2
LLHDTQPEEEKTLLELKVKKAPAPTALRDEVGPSEVPVTPAPIGGAAAGAAVLTAVDEDEEDGEEAPVPNDFDYLSDNEGEDE